MSLTVHKVLSNVQVHWGGEKEQNNTIITSSHPGYANSKWLEKNVENKCCFLKLVLFTAIHPWVLSLDALSFYYLMGSVITLKENAD